MKSCVKSFMNKYFIKFYVYYCEHIGSLTTHTISTPTSYSKDPFS